MKLPRFSQPSTLHLTFPFGQTFALAVLILALIVGVAEAVARLPLVKTRVPMAVGSHNPTFDVKIGELDRLVDEQGPVDCIFLGSSVVLNGINPALFEPAYREQTGYSIACYNFGVVALTTQTAGSMAEVLVSRYHPSLLIYGFTLRELAAGVAQGETVHKDIMYTPWMKYQTGSFNVQGWLVEHLAAYRHYLALRDWPSFRFRSPISSGYLPLSNGYHPFLETRTFDPATFNTPSYFADYQIGPDEWAGLEQIAALHPDPQVLLIELPLPGFVIDRFDGGAAGYRRVLDRVGDYAATQDVMLWTTSDLNLIPDDGWAEDMHHTNDAGAAVFSRWLGEQVGAAVDEGVIAGLAKQGNVP